MNSTETHFARLVSYAFRLLFILVVVQALSHITIWQLIWWGLLEVDPGYNPVLWHGHEMVVGFAGAAIAGFLLTAVATWTGRAPVRGWPLIVLCLSWLIARTVMIFPTGAAVASIFYWVWLLILMGREVLQAKNRRNYKILIVLLLMLVLELLFQYSLLADNGWTRQVVWSQLWLTIVLVTIVGGRIIPAFTRNWLRMNRPELSEKQQPASFGRLDVIATIVLLAFALATLVPMSASVQATFAITGGILQLWRLWRWRGIYTLADPLVWMLHLSYAWIPLAMFLFAMSQYGYVSVSAGIHALTIGAIASMIVSVASRAALGHTGRPLVSHPLLTAAIVLLTLSAIVRIIAVLVPSPTYITGSALLWLLGFLCFAIRYLPILTSAAHQDST